MSWTLLEEDLLIHRSSARVPDRLNSSSSNSSESHGDEKQGEKEKSSARRELARRIKIKKKREQKDILRRQLALYRVLNDMADLPGWGTICSSPKEAPVQHGTDNAGNGCGYICPPTGPD